MKIPPALTSLHIRVRGMFHKETIDYHYTPMPPLHEDLSGLSMTEIDGEIEAIEHRIEQAMTQPEGLDGLNYRLSRLQAQKKALERKP